MASVFQRLRSWWNKDAIEEATEEAHMSQAERDVAEEDYEGHKDDLAQGGGYLAGTRTDFESDSETPRR
jgi:hypothetical protein